MYKITSMALKFPKTIKQIKRTANKQGSSPHQHDIKQHGACSSSVAPLFDSIGNLDAEDDNEGYKAIMNYQVHELKCKTQGLCGDILVQYVFN